MIKPPSEPAVFIPATYFPGRLGVEIVYVPARKPLNLYAPLALVVVVKMRDPPCSSIPVRVTTIPARPGSAVPFLTPLLFVSWKMVPARDALLPDTTAGCTEPSELAC